jgi:hypothetical protein
MELSDNVVVFAQWNRNPMERLMGRTSSLAFRRMRRHVPPLSLRGSAAGRHNALLCRGILFLRGRNNAIDRRRIRQLLVLISREKTHASHWQRLVATEMSPYHRFGKSRPQAIQAFLMRKPIGGHVWWRANTEAACIRRPSVTVHCQLTHTRSISHSLLAYPVSSLHY